MSSNTSAPSGNDPDSASDGVSVETGADPAIEGSVTPAGVPPEPVKPSASIPEPPPYAAFVAQVLGLALCFSILALSAAYNIAHGGWHVFPIAAVAFMVAIVWMIRLPGALRRIERPDNAADEKKLVWFSAGFMILFIGAAAIVGAAVGTSGKETGQLLADSDARSRLAKSISQVRDSAEGTIPAQIAMYKEIEPAVEIYDRLLQRMQVELPAYDEKFPTQHAYTEKNIRSVERDLKRTDLIKQEIGVARDIELFDPVTQKRSWQERMQPLLDAENELD